MHIGRLRTSFLDLFATVRSGPKTSNPADRVRYHGKAVSTDVIEASALAYLKALNKAVRDQAAPEV